VRDHLFGGRLSREQDADRRIRRKKREMEEKGKEQLKHK